jgi:hypothetical protein
MLQDWRQLQHAVFEERNVWSLFNAFTEALKEGRLAELAKWTKALQAFWTST